MHVSGKAVRQCFIAILIAAAAYLFGCSHGPVRHYTLGYYRYATIEFTKRSHWALKPLALPFGLVTDAVLIMADTAATPVAPFILPPIEVSYSDDPEINGAANTYIPSYPFTLVKIGLLGMGSGNQEEYEELFGFESTLFRDQMEAGSGLEEK
ncbi:MAG: hypothetical protein R6X10_12150 [Desulfobacterales bacterium]